MWRLRDRCRERSLLSEHLEEIVHENLNIDQSGELQVLKFRMSMKASETLQDNSWWTFSPRSIWNPVCIRYMYDRVNEGVNAFNKVCSVWVSLKNFGKYISVDQELAHVTRRLFSRIFLAISWADSSLSDQMPKTFFRAFFRSFRRGGITCCWFDLEYGSKSSNNCSLNVESSTR